MESPSASTEPARIVGAARRADLDGRLGQGLVAQPIESVRCIPRRSSVRRARDRILDSAKHREWSLSRTLPKSQFSWRGNRRSRERAAADMELACHVTSTRPEPNDKHREPGEPPTIQAKR